MNTTLGGGASASQPASGWRVLSVTSLGVMLCFINSSTLNVALPTIVRDLGATPVQASWVLLSYMLLLTMLILVFGHLGDIMGRRRLYLLGLATLVIASGGCAIAPNVEVLLGFRCLQAVGAAAVIANTTALLADAFPPRTLGLGLGLNATISAAAQSVGPVLGSLVVGVAGWRSIFLLNIPLGVVALVWAYVVLARDVRSGRDRIDYMGGILSSIGLAGIVYALSMGGPNGWTDTTVIIGLVVGLVAICAFTIAQRMVSHPMIDLDLFADRSRASAYVAVMLISMANVSSVLLGSLYMQAFHGMTALQAGLVVAPVPIGMMLASPLSGRLLRRFNYLTLSLVGMFLVAVGQIALIVAIGRPNDAVILAGALLCIGLGIGTFLTPNNLGIIYEVRPDRRGVANGMRSALQNTGLVTGTALALSVATGQLSAAGQHAVYSGDATALSTVEAAIFIGGVRLAMGVMLIVVLLGVAILFRTRRRHTMAVDRKTLANATNSPPQ